MKIAPPCSRYRVLGGAILAAVTLPQSVPLLPLSLDKRQTVGHLISVR
jgi:hypothetical protein